MYSREWAQDIVREWLKVAPRSQQILRAFDDARARYRDRHGKSLDATLVQVLGRCVSYSSKENLKAYALWGVVKKKAKFERYTELFLADEFDLAIRIYTWGIDDDGASEGQQELDFTQNLHGKPV